MARVEYGAMITNLKGSVGGFTFQENSSGAIVRARPQQKITPTPKQTTAQALHATMLNGWQRLTLAQKQAWNTYAAANTKTNAFGQVKTLTGQNWFESINVIFDQMGIATVNTPPSHSVPSAPPAYTINITDMVIEVIFNPNYQPTDEDLQIWTTPPIRRASEALQNQYRLTSIVTGDDYGTIDLTSDWEATHSIPWPPAANTACFTIGIMVRSCSRNSGICSVGTRNIDGFDDPIIGIGYWMIGTTFTVS